MDDWDEIEAQADDGGLACEDCGCVLDADEVRMSDDFVLCPDCFADDRG